MHGNLDLILTLAAGLTAALAFGYVTHRLGLSPIVGYLLAGVLIGPHTPGFVGDVPIAQQLGKWGKWCHFCFRIRTRMLFVIADLETVLAAAFFEQRLS